MPAEDEIVQEEEDGIPHTGNTPQCLDNKTDEQWSRLMAEMVMLGDGAYRGSASNADVKLYGNVEHQLDRLDRMLVWLKRRWML
ncbi:hypothetical protein ACLMJK_009731 [Lecanora helva]